MTAKDRKSDLSYSNNLVDQDNKTYNHSTGKKPINADCSALTENMGTNTRATKFKFKVNDRIKITNYKNIFSKG